MGVVYRLRPEIIDFIVEQKKADPLLSCRGLVALVSNKFNIPVSKSSINSVIKEANLSMPVGRRPKHKKVAPKTVLTHEELKPAITEPTATPPVVDLIAPPAPLTLIPYIEAEPKILLNQTSENLDNDEGVVIKEAVGSEVSQGPAIEKTEYDNPPAFESIKGASTEIGCTGLMILKAVDAQVGGSQYFSQLLRNKLNSSVSDILPKTDYFLYSPLLEMSKQTQYCDSPELWSLIGRKIPQEELSSYLNAFQLVNTDGLQIKSIISNLFKYVRSIKLNSEGNANWYLDGQIHAVWTTPHIPYDFSTTLYSAKTYINKYFMKNEPIILFTSTNDESCFEDFFALIFSLNSGNKSITGVTFYNSKSQELEKISLEPATKRHFIFALWPWQFVKYRKVNKIGEFVQYPFPMLQKDLYLAPIEVQLMQQDALQHVTLNGCAIKLNANDKILLVILSNMPEQNPQELAANYLNHWPNLKHSFEDFTRRIELFTYSLTDKESLSAGMSDSNAIGSSGTKALFSSYLQALNEHIKRFYLPIEYNEKDFSTIKECFYDLKTTLKQEKDYILVTFKPPQDYKLLNDLEYLCRRLNEQEASSGNKKLWFSF